jgi:AraC family transcriptional regulator
LSAAARRLTRERTRILDVALDCGFRDLANFNHAFRAEFGVSPREFRRG